MLQTTTNVLQGKTIVAYHGIVSGEAIMGANIVRDLFASVTDIVGGRSAAYEDKLAEGRQIALNEMEEHARRMGANAIIGIDLDFETVREGMMMCIATGTAVTYQDGK
ncbi:YbjQ family protein [Sporosarcina sp. Te-1]|uniref:YbjQ family protein n=1 Tax=Sporosarcina sp. Te-1 TaxID=2818390 RepID=UPI001A9F3F44|nr:YbjQ family protein [Sporosarcina sp. Te-1]QTD39730.1 YbjQ family protein [Sporosarcina sp. Te-1]